MSNAPMEVPMRMEATDGTEPRRSGARVHQQADQNRVTSEGLDEMRRSGAPAVLIRHAERAFERDTRRQA